MLKLSSCRKFVNLLRKLYINFMCFATFTAAESQGKEERGIQNPAIPESYRGLRLLLIYLDIQLNKACGQWYSGVKFLV